VLVRRLQWNAGMGAIDKLAAKLGFVKLQKYGLVHTGDDRIMSTRPTVLDDGLGGKIVGWLESDLAAMELERWGVTKLAPAKKIELPKPAAVVAIAPKPLPGVAAFVPPPAPAPVPVAVVPVAAPQVAPEPPVEEDEWEWEIAVARARAEAKQLAAEPAPAPIPAPRVPKVTSQPVAATAKAVVSALTPETKPAAPAPKFVSTPGTVIPVPALPQVADPRMVRPAVVPATAPRRFPKATGRVEDTIRTHAAPPANDDKTSPSIALPPASGVKRVVAAKQR